MKVKLSTDQIQELLTKRFELIEMINSCRTSVNEISLNSVQTISLTDLEKNIDFGKYPELYYLFSDQNINYLRPYHGSLQGIEDNDLGIVSKGLVTAEIALLTGIDLSGRNSPFTSPFYTKSLLDKVKDKLVDMGIKTKNIVKFEDVINLKSLYANNVENYNIASEYSYPTNGVFYDEEDNTIIFSDFKENVYDLLYSLSILDEINVSTEISSNSVEIDLVEKMTLNDAILDILEIIPTHVDNGMLYLSEYPDCFIEYDGGPVQCEIADFIEAKCKELIEGDDSNVGFIESLCHEMYYNLNHYKIDGLSDINQKINEFIDQYYDEY